MEPEAEKLITESINVNYVDAEQYPSSTEIQNRYVNLTAITHFEARFRGACHTITTAMVLTDLSLLAPYQNFDSRMLELLECTLLPCRRRQWPIVMIAIPFKNDTRVNSVKLH